MADVDKPNNYQAEQCNKNDQKISSLIEQIYEELIGLREDDVELIEQLTSLYDGLCHLRRTVTHPPGTSSTDISIIPIQIDSPTSTYYQTKPRSDSEPNILSNRQRIPKMMDDVQ